MQKVKALTAWRHIGLPHVIFSNAHIYNIISMILSNSYCIASFESASSFYEHNISAVLRHRPARHQCRFKALVTPLLKKANLDKENLSNYRPISHLSFLSKLTERIVLARLHDYVSSNSFLNPHQSGFTNHHSTETLLVSLYNKLVSAVSHQQVSCLCLLDISAAFDTIDHNILLQRLSSWFGVSGTALLWFQSY